MLQILKWGFLLKEYWSIKKPAELFSEGKIISALGEV
jgi:hypothetical protein